jgi:hypothetical protein
MNGMASWRPRTIHRFIRSYPTSTNVVRVETDAGEGFLKAMGNPEGPHVLACELVGSMLADWLGLPTLDHAIVGVTADDEIPLISGGAAVPGPAFITKAENGFPWGGDEETLTRIRNPEDISRLVILDTWVRNCDRHRPEPDARENRDNVFLARETAPERALVLKAMDLTHAFTCGRELTPRINRLEEVRDTTIFGCFAEFRQFMDRDIVQSSASHLAEMNKAQAGEFVAQVPAEWEVEAAVREAWVAFIVDRAEFVSGNVASLLWP